MDRAQAKQKIAESSKDGQNKQVHDVTARVLVRCVFLKDEETAPQKVMRRKPLRNPKSATKARSNRSEEAGGLYHFMFGVSKEETKQEKANGLLGAKGLGCYGLERRQKVPDERQKQSVIVSWRGEGKKTERVVGAEQRKG